MKSNFKPLGIAAAVAAATAGYANVASAQDPVVANNALGDLALVPYYTVADDWITGIHLVNTSDQTQVVKFRFRRADDSMDALDFNVIMSPKDVYAGFLSDDENGVISWQADDTTCTAPLTSNGKLEMPSIFRPDAETGYVEIIAMGAADEDQPISYYAKHVDGEPRDCEVVSENFFADGSSSREGVEDFETTWSSDPLDFIDEDDLQSSTYTDSENVIKVSYFIRDNDTGVEFGDNAVHIQNFQTVATMTNQQFGFLSGDLDGFDFPDIDGGSPNEPASRGRYNLLRDGGVLGVAALVNEWTANEANGAALDWVVTLPGQYTQLHLPGYVAALSSDAIDCVRPSDPTGILPSAITGADLAGASASSPLAVICDYRDIPVTAIINAWNREEFAGEDPDESLVVSPAPPGSTPAVILDKEVNVVTFGGNSVLGVSDTDVSADLEQPFGWLTLSVTAASDAANCEWNPATDTTVGTSNPPAAQPVNVILAQKTCVGPNSTLEGSTPIIGFAAWERNVAANPDASYGRIVAHSFISGS